MNGWTFRWLSVSFSAVILSLAARPALGQDAATREGLVQGVTLRVYEVADQPAKLVRLVQDQTPNIDERRDVIDFRSRGDFSNVDGSSISTLTGFLDVKEAGRYDFRLTIDDGGRLTLNGQVVIECLERGRSVQTGSIDLQPGLVPLLVDHFDSGGQRQLTLEWKVPGAEKWALVPAEVLLTEDDPTRVTSPGKKQILHDTRPGDGRPLTSVHPAWDLATVRPEGFEPLVGAMAFLPDGRLVVGTFSPMQRTETSLPDIDAKESDKLHALTGVTGDPADVTVEIVADGLYEPSGMCVYNGDLYVTSRKSIIKLTDTDGDGFFETHDVVAEGWEGWNYHQFVFGLLARDGKLYTALSTTMAPPAWEGMTTNSGPSGPMRGGILEIDIETNDVRVIAGGTRTPNGLGWGPEGSLMYLDNQGSWMSTSLMAEVVSGRFLGHYNVTSFVPKLAKYYPEGGHESVFADRPRSPAAVYLPHNEVSNSPTQVQLIEEGPFAGQMYMAELTNGGIRRLFLERVNGQWQGAIFRFTQGLESGVNRLEWGPDGSLYTGGIGANGNWAWRDTKYGLQRLTPNGTDVFEFHSMSATPDGFDVRFTKPVDPDWLADATHYQLKQWHYVHTAAYGGRKIDQVSLTASTATPHEDGMGVRLVIDGVEAGNVVYLRTDPTATDGEQIWSTEAWYTLNEVPLQVAPATATLGEITVDPATGVGVGVLPPAEAVPLLSASADVAFKYEGADGKAANRTGDDLLALPGYVEVGGGNFISKNSFGNARLHIEFYCPPGGEGQQAGNSGVYLHGLYELQVLGTLAGDEQLADDELGAIYKQKAADVNASTGPGTWQAYDIWFQAPEFDNGKKTANARVTAYLNGTLIHDDVELKTPTGSRAATGEPVQVGPLVLQDHSTDAEGPVRYRNIWIAPLQPTTTSEGHWVDLLENDSLDPWLVRGGNATFELNNGTVTGTSAPNTPNTFLTTKKTYGDFELLLEVKQHPGLNSGIQIRSDIRGGIDQRDGRLFGYQVEMDPSSRGWSGGLYDEGRRGWLYPLSDAPYARRAYKADDWNKVRIVARGPVIRTWINGIPAASVFDAVDNAGHIALQVHGVGERADPMTVEFRNVRLRELDLAR